MLVLTIRTDNPEAAIGLYDGEVRLVVRTWQAHRELASTIHRTIEDVLASQSKRLSDIEGIVCFQGPGSFTGLRIGLTVANALAYSLSVPVVATRTDDWTAEGLRRLQAGEDDHIALPHYGAPVHITQQKK